RAIGEITVRFAVTGIVMAREGMTGSGRPFVQRGRLGALHVRAVAAQPHHARRPARPVAGGDAGSVDVEMDQLVLCHGSLLKCACRTAELTAEGAPPRQKSRGLTQKA